MGVWRDAATLKRRHKNCCVMFVLAVFFFSFNWSRRSRVAASDHTTSINLLGGGFIICSMSNLFRYTDARRRMPFCFFFLPGMCINHICRNFRRTRAVAAAQNISQRGARARPSIGFTILGYMCGVYRKWIPKSIYLIKSAWLLNLCIYAMVKNMPKSVFF